MDLTLLLAVLGSIALLLLLVLWLRLSAFLALLIASIACGLLAGLSPQLVLDNISAGMGNTLAYVATIVGLGAILGAVLEHAGGTQALARFLLDRLGERRAPLAFVLTGFLIAIPVFFDVAFVILVPLLYATSRRTGRSLLFYAIPLLAGLATTHAFIPPTPGPIAVADILGAELGWIIFWGFIVGIPTVSVAGLWWGRRVGRRFDLAPPTLLKTDEASTGSPPAIGLVLGIIFIPILLILVHTLTRMLVDGAWVNGSWLTETLIFLGHPYIALLLSCLIALYWLGIRRGTGRQELQQLATKALGPAGIIILITGAGGVYKQMLMATGAGEALA
ncbi:MAG: gluconate transporter, partial [Lewinella sp.]|nr:gluconate transporter [Lewinella sp.]